MSPLQLQMLLEMYTNPLARDVDIANKLYTSVSTVSYTTAQLGLHTQSRVQLYHVLGYIELPDVMPDGGSAMVNNTLRAMQQAPSGSLRHWARIVGYTPHTMTMTTKYTYNYFGMPMPETRNRSRHGFYAHMGWFDTERLARDAKMQYDALQEATYATTI
jgi:hypothetical protein